MSLGETKVRTLPYKSFGRSKLERLINAIAYRVSSPEVSRRYSVCSKEDRRLEVDGSVQLSAFSTLYLCLSFSLLLSFLYLPNIYLYISLL